MQPKFKIQFYLVGPTPRKCRDIQIDLSDDIKTVKKAIGEQFHIVDPNGKSEPSLTCESN